MFKSIKKQLAVGVALSLLLAMTVVAPVAAQQTPTTDSPDLSASAVITSDQSVVVEVGPGTNRETAGPPFPDSQQLNPGEPHWYRFRYVFDEDRDDEPGQAVVRLKMDRVGCARFEVTTSGRLNFPRDDDGDWVGPIGRGTPFNDGNRTDASTLLWVGSGKFSETHFVIVIPTSDQPCNYTLSITGSPVVY